MSTITTINNNENTNQLNYSTLPTTSSIPDQNEKKKLIIFEPYMLLYMFTTFAKFPVFQSLLYEKACLNSQRFDEFTCQNNISAIHKDVQLQKEANYLLIASTLSLFIPSIPSALLLGAMFDAWSSRKTLLIPLIGLLLADLNYILQSILINSSPFWLLFSDLFFGFTGGFTSIIGLFFAYSVRLTPLTFRPTRMALMEGSMGLGGMCGYLLSGQLRQHIGYAWFFIFLSILHLIVFIQIIFFCKELINKIIKTTINRLEEENEEELSSLQENKLNLLKLCQQRFLDILKIFKNQNNEEEVNKNRKNLNLILIVLLIEFICFSGLMDILFSFLRFQLKWTDKEYGWFNGIDTGSASFCIIFLYPLLQKNIGISNLRLTIFGLINKIGSIIILAFTTSTLIAFLSIFLSIFGRFVPTGLRAIASSCVNVNEQGKIFSLMSLLQSIGYLIASPLFNGIYPFTLKLFPGTMLLIIGIILIIPVIILIYLDVKKRI